MGLPTTGPITDRGWNMLKLKESLSLYFIMGSVNCSGDPKSVLLDAISTGVTMFQFREKGEGCLQGEEAVQLAKELREICRNNEIPFIVNDNVELAMLIDADGVHIGQEDRPPHQVRKRIGDKILGISAHNPGEARNAIEAGADYLGVGPMFQTTTKTNTRPVSGPAVINQMRREGIHHPLVGIGGITHMNAEQVLEAGADGIAVISEISKSPSPKDAAARLKAIVEKVTK
jgi:thiamine-phosphate pyrophosphorylase